MESEKVKKKKRLNKKVKWKKESLFPVELTLALQSGSLLLYVSLKTGIVDHLCSP